MSDFELVAADLVGVEGEGRGGGDEKADGEGASEEVATGEESGGGLAGLRGRSGHEFMITVWVG